MSEKPGKLRTVVIGGIIIGIMIGTPVLYIINYFCCCGGIMLGGLFSLYLYRKKFTDEYAPLESSDALILGIFSGIAGAFIGSVLSVLCYYLFGFITEEVMLKIIEIIKQDGDVSAEYKQSMDQFTVDLKTKIELGLRLSDVLGSLIINLIICPIFSMLGGLIGFGIFEKKRPVQQPPPPIQ